jgi:hypothetical protein
MVRYYIKEKPVFHDDKCLIEYRIWADYGPFWNFVLTILPVFTLFVFDSFLETNIRAYNKESAEKKLQEYVKFKQLGG